jgi:Domain of unknown function (DUF4365)
MHRNAFTVAERPLRVKHRPAPPVRRRRASRASITGRVAPGALDDSWGKEDVSIAYVHALATAVGVTCDHSHRDINGWDVHSVARDTEDADALQLAAQLECTVNRLTRVDGGRSVSFQLKRSDYNHLCKSPAHPPWILVVVEAAHDHRPRSRSSRCAASTSSPRSIAAASAIRGQPAPPEPASCPPRGREKRHSGGRDVPHMFPVPVCRAQAFEPDLPA